MKPTYRIVIYILCTYKYLHFADIRIHVSWKVKKNKCYGVHEASEDTVNMHMLSF